MSFKKDILLKYYIKINLLLNDEFTRSTVPIHFQLDFLKEYNYPQVNSDEKYKLIILPKEWALDGVGITENMTEKLPTYFYFYFSYWTKSKSALLYI